jgi:hypothetical protein
MGRIEVAWTIVDDDTLSGQPLTETYIEDKKKIVSGTSME